MPHYAATNTHGILTDSRWSLTQHLVLDLPAWGGQFPFRTESGTRELYWLNADPNERRPDEPWPEYATRSCAEVLACFRTLMSSVQWDTEAAKWKGLLDELKGKKLLDVVAFQAYFVSEVEYAQLRNS